MRAEILGGLEEGDQIVLYPSDTLSDGTRLKERGGKGMWFKETWLAGYFTVLLDID
jgi:hypothetical protein